MTARLTPGTLLLMESFPSRIKSIEDLNRVVRHLVLQRADGREMAFAPGQYVVVHERGAFGADVAAAYSLCGPPAEDETCAICISRRSAGECSERLLERRVGEEFRVQGPMGRLTLPDAVAGDLVLVATGTGVSPFHAMLPRLRQLAAERSVWLLLGARSEDELLFDGDWRQLAAQSGGFSYCPVVSRPTGDWSGTEGHVGDLLERLPSLERGAPLVYLCGHQAMVAELTAEFQRRGVPESSIRVER